MRCLLLTSIHVSQIQLSTYKMNLIDYEHDTMRIDIKISRSSSKLIKISFNCKTNIANESKILKLGKVYISLDSMTDHYNRWVADTSMLIMEMRAHNNTQTHSICEINHIISIKIWKYIKRGYLWSIWMSLHEWGEIRCVMWISS